MNAGAFVAPFKRDRMTWIKPSFRWMGYRSGWATKTNQDKVLAIEITRDGYDGPHLSKRPIGLYRPA
nr:MULTISPECIES: DUF4291 family protein [unclassified Frankia]